MPITWGSKGFSTSVVIDDVRVPVCYAYHPHSVYKQCLFPAFAGSGSIRLKTAVPEKVIQEIKEGAVATGLFTPAGQDIKCLIEQSLKDDDVQSILELCESIAAAIREYGLKR